MANKKSKHWRSVPDSRKKKTATYPRPENHETYHIRRDSAFPYAGEPTAAREAFEAESAQMPQRRTQTAAGTQVRREKPRTAPPRAASEAERERLKKQKIKKKKRKNIALRACIASVVLVAVLTVSVFVLFKIGEIKVEGVEVYNAAQIIDASEIEPGDNLYAASAPVIEKKVSQRLPYVKEITLKHRLPSTLIICVTETKAKFAFEASTKFILTDADLKFLEVADKLPHGAAVIEGVGLKGAEIGEKAEYKDKDKGSVVNLINAELSKNKLENITLISVKNPIELTAVYDDRITILFGQSNDLVYKCQLAASTIQSILKENKNAEGTVNVKQASETKQAYYNPNS